MIPTPIVEHLLAIRRPGGGTLVGTDATQILVPAFPPNTTLSFSAGPIEEDYAQIVTGASLGLGMVPNAFFGFLQIWGLRVIQGLMTQNAIQREYQSFVWVTESEPALLHFSNISGLNQVFELDYVSLRIATEEDMESVMAEIEHMASSARSEQLAEEANRLLRVRARPGMPPAP